jgi:DNA-binding NtrC family response regulator
LSPEASASLEAYSWPGNVRELENLLERASLLAEGAVIGPELLGMNQKKTAPLLTVDGAEFVGKSAEEVERAHVLATLRHTNWHQKRAAELLGIGVRTLREKVKRWNLKEEEEASRTRT